MDDLDILARDFGFGPGGTKPRSAKFSDVFGEPAKFTPNTNYSTNNEHSSMRDFEYDSMFNVEAKSVTSGSSKTSSAPVYDKPVYDDDVFEGLPGLKSKSAGISSPRSSKGGNHNSDFDDLLGNLGRREKATDGIVSSSSSKGFDDLFAGFGSGVSAASNRPITESNVSSVPVNGSKHGSVLDESYVVLESVSTQGSSSYGVFQDSMEDISKHGKSRSTSAEASSGGGRGYGDLDPLDSFEKPAHSFSRGTDKGGKERSLSRSASPEFAAMREQKGNSSFRYSVSNMEKRAPPDNLQEPPLFEMPKFSTNFRMPFDHTASPQYFEASSQVDMSSTSSRLEQQSDDVWLTVSEIPLFTQPTAAPPPSRPPPPIPHQISRSETVFSSSSSKKKGDKFPSPSNLSQHYQSPKLSRPVTNGQQLSQFDEVEDFAQGRSENNIDENANLHFSEDNSAFSASATASAAAMKEAMEKAEAKFRHAKEVREREYAKAARHREPVQLEKDEQDGHERDLRETREILELERKQKEEEERERRRLQRDRERSREIEREKARQAVERANREARERAAAQAREKAAADTRLRSERAAVEKANAEARERAGRVAVQRAQAEARERAATEARERATTAETKEKELREKDFAARAEVEARRRAERGAVERAAAEARGRAAAEARERAAVATSAKMNQQRNDDLESFFSMGRASSAPKAHANSTDPFFNQQFQNKGGSEPGKRTSSSSGASSNMKKASSTTNIVDDLSSIFGASSAGEFQEVEGETEERRRARLLRDQRTQERAAKALAEKNQRDLQAQREQEERHRIAENFDIEIKRWAAGKEGNLRALLSTLQYVLWPECGWQPVSLTDLINGASVKKVYRKATLCIHPDKVQQKGATLQQKYIAEKVFDLLKEAWNKFNSEELF